MIGVVEKKLCAIFLGRSSTLPTPRWREIFVGFIGEKMGLEWSAEVTKLYVCLKERSEISMCSFFVIIVWYYGSHLAPPKRGSVMSYMLVQVMGEEAM